MGTQPQIMLRHEIPLRITNRRERVRLQPLLGAEQTVGLREYFQIAFGRLRGCNTAFVRDLAPHAEELGPSINEMPPDRRDDHSVDRRDGTQQRRR